MTLPWTVIGSFAFIAAAAYTAYRWWLVHTVRHMERMGALIGWDVDIFPFEGGTLNESESREITRLRKIVHARPLVVFFSEQFKGSEKFASHEIRRLRHFGFLKRLAFDGVPVRYDDLCWLSERVKVEELAIYDICLADEQRRRLEGSGRYKFTYEAPVKAT